jgi:hypothetical protein
MEIRVETIAQAMSGDTRDTKIKATAEKRIHESALSGSSQVSSLKQRRLWWLKPMSGI